MRAIKAAVIFVVGAVLAAGFVRPVFATLSSPTYKVTDEVLNSGGGFPSSATYSADAQIGSPIYSGTLATPPDPGGGGGGSPPPPAPPPAPPPPAPGDTAPPVLNNVRAENILAHSLHVLWNTDEAASSTVAYGLTTSYELGVVTDGARITSHDITLLGLDPSTTYHFEARSGDAAGNVGRSGDRTVTTRASDDANPPILSNIAIRSITDHSAEIYWETDEPATSAADYGLTDAYELGPATSDALTRTRAITISNLAASTLYHARVRSTDANGNQAVGTDRTFTTENDTTPPPNVTTFRAVASSPSSVGLTWNNPVAPDFDATIVVRRTDRFPADASDGSRIYNGAGESITDTGLAADTDYFYAAFARDTSGNTSSGSLGEAHTPAAPVSPPPEPPPPSPPPEPAVPVPAGETNPSGIGSAPLAQARFLLSGRTIVASIVGGQITVLPGSVLSVVVPIANQPRPLASVTMNLGNDSFRLVRNESQQIFEADVSAPAAPGNSAGTLILAYEDGTFENIPFTLAVVGYGIVEEVLSGKITPVFGATVTLLDGDTGALVPWDGSRYRAANPVETSANGIFGFLVPAGVYAVRVEKFGYLTFQTGRITSSGNVVNISARVVALPESLVKKIKPDAPLAENVSNVLEGIGENIGFALQAAPRIIRRAADNPQVEKAAESVASPTAIGVGAAAAAAGAASAAPFASLGLLLRAFITQPLLLLARRRRKQWGSVYHTLLKLPIDLAIVRLIEPAGRVVQTQVTDGEGRFFFIASPGTYRIEVIKPGFVYPSELLRTATADGDVADLYHGEEIRVTEAGTALTPNIPLDPVEKTEQTHARITRRALIRSLQYAFSAAAVLISLGSLIVNPTVFTAVFFAVQIALFEFFRRVARVPKPQGWGIVYDTQSNRPLRYAFARIFDTQFNKLLDTKVTDASGRYAFLVGRNKFRVTFDREGYTPRELLMDVTKEKRNVITERVGLAPGAAAPPPPPLPPTPPISPPAEPPPAAPADPQPPNP